MVFVACPLSEASTLTAKSRPLAGSFYLLVEFAPRLLEFFNIADMQLTVGRDLLEHSFYQRWVRGELTVDELRDYAGQYAHVVRRLPVWLRRTAVFLRAHASSLQHHAIEEESHDSLWTEFASAIGVARSLLVSTRPNSMTAELLRLGDELTAKPTGVGVPWAIEAQSPAVSVEKLRGLKAHYGIDEANGGAYFDVHSSRDLDHIVELNKVIADLSADARRAAQVAAHQVTNRLWDLLTSVEHAA